MSGVSLLLVTAVSSVLLSDALVVKEGSDNSQADVRCIPFHTPVRKLESKLNIIIKQLNRQLCASPGELEEQTRILKNKIQEQVSTSVGELEDQIEILTNEVKQQTTEIESLGTNITMCSLSGRIPPGYTKMENMTGYLKYVTVDTNWESAEFDCQNDDPLGRTHLVVIDSQEKNDAVHKIISVDRDAWIGLRQKQGLRFMYGRVDGSTVTAVQGRLFNDGTDGQGFQNWGSNEEMDGDRHDSEDCVVIARSRGIWGDVLCSRLEQYVCEFIP